MKILAIGAHPDDIEVGCSGTLAKYAQAGHDIYLLVMTEGHMGGEGTVRKKEQMKSAKILKPRELIWGGCEDTSAFAPHEQDGPRHRGRAEEGHPRLHFCPV